MDLEKLRRISFSFIWPGSKEGGGFPGNLEKIGCAKIFRGWDLKNILFFKILHNQKLLETNQREGVINTSFSSKEHCS